MAPTWQEGGGQERWGWGRAGVVATGHGAMALTVYSACFFPYHFIHFLNSRSMVWKGKRSHSPSKPGSPPPASPHVCKAAAPSGPFCPSQVAGIRTSVSTAQPHNIPGWGSNPGPQPPAPRGHRPTCHSHAHSPSPTAPQPGPQQSLHLHQEEGTTEGRGQHAGLSGQAQHHPRQEGEGNSRAMGAQRPCQPRRSQKVSCITTRMHPSFR